VTTKLWARIQILMQFSRSRPRSGRRNTEGSETDASADATEEQADGDGAEADPDGLDELASVTSSLRSAQSRVSGDDDPDDDGDLSASDAGESGDA